MKGLRKYTCTVPEGYQPQLPVTCYHPAVIRQTLETYSFLPPSDVEGLLKENQVPFTGLQHEKCRSGRCLYRSHRKVLIM